MMHLQQPFVARSQHSLHRIAPVLHGIVLVEYCTYRLFHQSAQTCISTFCQPVAMHLMSKSTKIVFHPGGSAYTRAHPQYCTRLQEQERT